MNFGAHKNQSCIIFKTLLFQVIRKTKKGEYSEDYQDKFHIALPLPPYNPKSKGHSAVGNLYASKFDRTQLKSSLNPEEVQDAFEQIEINNQINGSDIPSLPWYDVTIMGHY